MKTIQLFIVAALVAAVTLLPSAGAGAQTLPFLNYSQDFNNGYGGWAHSGFDYNGFDVAGCVYGTGDVWINHNMCTCPDDGIMTSPAIGTAGGGAITVTYNYKAVQPNFPTAGAAGFGYISMSWSTSPGGPWTVFQYVDSNMHTTTAACITKSGTFTPPPGPVYLRFYATRRVVGGAQCKIIFDNVTATEAMGSACSGTPAGGTTTSNYALSCVNVPVTYTVSPYVNNSGYLFQWQSSPDGSTWADISGATGYQYTATQTASTWYRRKTTCTVTSQVAYSSGFQQNTTANPAGCLCSSGSTNISETDITNFSLGAINNSSGCQSLVGSQGTAIGSGGSYSNWTTGTVPAASLPQGTSQPFSLSYSTCTNGTTYTSSKIYIDFNGDSDFEDPGESVYAIGAQPNGGTVTGTLAIPAAATTGPRVLRIVHSSDYSYPGPCGSYSHGETEDYLVTIVAGPACAGTPASAVVTGPANTCLHTAFTLQATNFPLYGITGLSYQWQSSPASANTWTDIPGATTAPVYTNGTNPTATLTVPTGQTAATDYRLRVTCATSNLSSYSNTISVGMTAAASCYCAAGIANAGACQQWISNVSTSGLLTNVSNSSACTTGGYVNYTGTTQLSQYQDYPVNLSLTSGGGPMWWNVYVDYDNNGTFSSGELVYQNNNSAGALTVSGSFTIPVSTTTGTKRMRIQGNHYSTANTGNSCGASLTGETEDYALSILTKPVCNGIPVAGSISVAGTTAFCAYAPSRTFTATGYTTNFTGVTVNWQISTDSASNFTDLNATGPAYTSYSQTYPSTRYFRARITCAASGLSAYTNAIGLIRDPAVITVSPDTAEFCRGAGGVVLTATGGSTYSWTVTSAGLSCYNCANPLANPATTTTYTVTGTNATGCTGTATRTVTVNQRPTVNTATASPAAICAGQPVSLSGTVFTPGTYTGFGGPFAPEHWTETSSSSNGSINTSGAPAQIVFITSDSVTTTLGQNTWTIPIVQSGNITFDWSYTTNDSAGNDQLRYSTGQTYSDLAGFSLSGPDTQSGTATIPVLAGSTFGLRCRSRNGVAGRAVITITNFSGPGGIPGSVQWYDAPTGGNLIATPASVVPPGPGPVIYYAEGVSTAGGCPSSTRKPSNAVTFLPAGRWTGTTSADWSTAGNWCGGVPTATTDVVIPGAITVPNMPVLGAAGNVRNIMLDTAASLTLNAAGVLNVYGNITGPGSLNAAAGSVNFTGSGTQAVTPGFTVGTLSVNGASTKTLSGNVLVNTALNLTSGVLDIGSDTLRLAAGAVINGGSAGSYVRTSATGGRLIQAVGSTVVAFPVGHSTYNPVALTNTGVADNFSVGVRETVLSLGTSGLPVDTGSFRMVNRTWDVSEQVPAGSNVTMTLGWNAGELNTPSFDYSHVFVSHFTGGQWTYDPAYTGSTPAPAAGGYPGAGPYSATRTGITSFSPFSVASSLGGVPLPVTLVKLSAANTGTRNRISWTTMNEKEMASYTVERSADGRDFRALASVAAQHKPADYTAYDDTPEPGFTYYRLKMNNADGSFAWSPTVNAFLGTEGAVAIIVHPNPVKDVVTVRLDGAAGGDVHLIDLSGRTLSTTPVRSGEAQISMSSLAPGTYFLRYTSNAVSKTIRISKQ